GARRDAAPERHRRGPRRAAGGRRAGLRPVRARDERPRGRGLGPRPADRRGDRRRPRGAGARRGAGVRHGRPGRRRDPPAPRAPGRPRGGRVSQILVVEDAERIASFVAKGLRAAGYTPLVVGTGREAFDHATSGDVDLVILDLGLPDQDGFTVLRRLREARSTVPVIILTARGSVTDTVAGLEGGADDYMAKPFRFEELLARV